MHASEITRLSAMELRAALSRGRLTPRDVAEASRARITHREAQVGAFAHIDWNQVDKQIKNLRNQPTEAGPLWGVPVGIKDLFDTADLPTAYGSDIYAGHRPAWDAPAVARLRTAGAVILGKTVTTEFAWRRAGKTRNPLDARFSPGGSSSGSAASVADRMVPVAIGSQTAGSIIRPAAFCGIVGFKPTFGLISTAGVKPLAQSLDTVGAFARTVADVGLIAGVMAARSDWTSIKPPKKTPKLALVRGPEWDLVSQAALTATQTAAEELVGKTLQKRKAPKDFLGLVDAHVRIVGYEAARELYHEKRSHPERLSPILRGLLEDGAGISPSSYQEALSLRDECLASLDDLFGDADVLVAPAALGEPPRAEEGTGDPVMCRAWTLLRLPSITIPLGKGPNGLPLGLQMAARPGDDTRLLSVAQWAEAKLGVVIEGY
jgi:Asp-tRNA(Asn)/Glu-tRNA(Gln) amidotransferase A subunit family amidase